MEKQEEQKLGCDYTGYDFGAGYIDSCCFDGYLWDMDDCDDNGNLYEPSELKPCPKCNHDEWLDECEDEIEDMGFNAFCDGIHEYVHKLIRFEQPQDLEKVKAWWQNGYNQAKADYEKDPSLF